MDCYTWAVIRLSAKHGRRQTGLTVAVFISSYVTHLTLSVCIWGFIAVSNYLPVNIIIVFIYFVQDYSRLINTGPHGRCCIKRLINYTSSVSYVDNKVTLLLADCVFKTKPIKCIWIMSGFNWITVVDLELSEPWECVLLIACLESVTSHKLGLNIQH